VTLCVRETATIEKGVDVYEGRAEKFNVLLSGTLIIWSKQLGGCRVTQDETLGAYGASDDVRNNPSPLVIEQNVN